MGIVGQRQLKAALTAHPDFLSGHTHIRNDEDGRFGWHFQDEVTIKISNSTHRSVSLHYNRGANQWFLACICHRSLDRYAVLRIERGAERQKHNRRGKGLSEQLF